MAAFLFSCTRQEWSNRGRKKGLFVHGAIKAAWVKCLGKAPHNWLVVSTLLKNMSSSVGMIIPNI